MRLLIAVFACSVLLAPLASPAQPSKSRLANAIAVIVNDAVITYADIEQFIAPAMDVLIRRYNSQPKVLEEKLAEARQKGTEQLVERQLILSDWKTSGYNLPESILDDEINDRIRERYGDRVTLTKTLQAQGMTWEAFRNQVREDIIVSALRGKNAGPQSIIISPQKIETYYVQNKDKYKVADQIKLRMIVVNKKSDNPDAAKKLLEEIRGKVVNDGAKFGEMASLYSEGSQRTQQGDWGWVEKSVLREDLAATAFSLKAGEVSQVVETATSCYLMLVEQVKPAYVQPLSEVRDQIDKTLLSEERARLQAKYVERLKAKSFVRYF